MAERAVSTAGFPKGLNTRMPTISSPDGSARKVENVDIYDDGRVRRRKGTTLTFSGVVHSVFGAGTHGFAVVDNDLSIIQNDTATTVRASVGTGRVWYLNLNGKTWWSNGIDYGVTDAAGTDGTWALATPPTPICTPSSTGGLYEGGYQLAVSYLTATGEEGGWVASTLVNVAAGGGIAVTGLPTVAPSSEVTQYRLYVTGANSTTQYRYGDYPIGTAAVTVTKTATLGEPETTSGLLPFPACTHLTYYRGRVYGVTGNVLWYSEPIRYRLCDLQKNFIMFDSDITMVADVLGGLYVSDSNTTWFLSGEEPNKFQRILALPYPAVFGSSVKDTKTGAAYWFSSRGWCVGGPTVVEAGQGQAKNLTENSVLPGPIDSAVTLIREYDGVGQVLAIVNEDGDSSATALT